jgi:hypothetical protein
MEISQTILKTVELLKKCLDGLVTVEIMDTKISRKFPDANTSLGYLGVTILINSGIKMHKVFLSQQRAEDILFGSVNPELMAKEFMMIVIKDDILLLERKMKLEKIIKINE